MNKSINATKAFMSWSGGKDSALAFYIAREQSIAIDALVTTVSAQTSRVSMHGVRHELIAQQAAAVGLPLQTISLPKTPGITAYQEAIHNSNRQFVAAGFNQAVFGDIFLEDLKRYREELMAADGLHCLFPLWKMDSYEVMRRFLHDGFKAIVVCVDSRVLSKSFCGRLLNEDFVADLPAGIDPCGENGEYHSFVFEGPIFHQPVSYSKGELVYQEYPAPIIHVEDAEKSDDCFTTPQPVAGFWFQDLMPA